MKEKDFNLLREPWILVLMPDGNTEEVSLLELFRNAHKFQALAGELPTQDVAILRLLLAILHAVYGRYNPNSPVFTQDNTPSPTSARKRWKALWDKGIFLYKNIEDYLLSYEERFYLFHPERPFYQVAFKEPLVDKDGKQVIPTVREASLLIGDIAESDNKVRLFSGRTQKDSLSYSEAARWLIYTNSFDIAPGGKPSEAGLTIKGYGLAWLSKLGLVWASGSNLFESLMLNFVMATKERVWENVKDAIWEQVKNYDVEELKNIAPEFPRNPCQLLSMQFRRIQLIRDVEQKRVIKYLLWSGQSLDMENAFLEHMTLWMKNKGSVYVPKLHNASRQMWRDFSAILSSSPDKKTPGVVDWIATLKTSENLNLPFIKLNIAGTEFKNKTAVIDVFSDSLRINLSLFTKLGQTWVSRIIAEIEITERLVKEVGWLKEALLKASGLKSGDRNEQLKLLVNTAMEQAYFRLDMPFRRWLERIDTENDNMDEACNIWWQQEKQIVQDLGRELVEEAGLKAFTGRYVKEKKKGKEENVRYVAPKAFDAFMRRTSSKQALKGGKK